MLIGFVQRHHTSVSGTPAFTPRFLRMAPASAEVATGSVAVANAQVRVSAIPGQRFR